MEYDKKIDDRAMVLNCLDVDFARDKYENSYGYFTDDIQNYSNLNKCEYGKLITIGNSNIPYKGGNGQYFRFFLPESAIKKEKKYRPYTIEEFLNEGFEVLNEGFEIVIFREKSNPSMEYHVRYNGYKKYDNVYNVILGNMGYTLSDLFEDFERFYNGRWFPFGVKEE